MNSCRRCLELFYGTGRDAGQGPGRPFTEGARNCGGGELQWSVVGGQWSESGGSRWGVETLLARHFALDTLPGKNKHGGLARAGRCGGGELQWSVVGGQWSESGDSRWRVETLSTRHLALDTLPGKNRHGGLVWAGRCGGAAPAQERAEGPNAQMEEKSEKERGESDTEQADCDWEWN